MAIAALLSKQTHKLNLRIDRGQRVARMVVMMAMVMIMMMAVVAMTMTMVTAMRTMMVSMVVVTRITVNRRIRPCGVVAESHRSPKRSWKSPLIGSPVCVVADPSAHADLDHMAIQAH